MKRRTTGFRISWILVWLLVIFAVSGIGRLLGSMEETGSQVERDKNMRTEDYQVEVEIREDNSYHVTETIRVDMRTQRHGIYRYVPVKGTITETDGERTPYYARVELLSCSDPVSTERDSGFYVMRLGDEERTVSGEQTYKIEYTLTPEFQEEGYSAVYYNLFPISWQNEIPAGSRFTVHFPKETDKEAIQLYCGEYGSRRDASSILKLDWRENSLTGTLQEDLALGSGITLYADVGAGYFTGTNRIAPFGAVILGGSLLVLGAVILLYYAFGRDEPVIPSVQFQPPVDLDSAAVGYIIDGAVENRDILSLILYWADRGHLKIRESGKKDLTLIRTELPLPEDAPGYEKTFYQNLFKKEDQVSIKSLKYKCANTIETAKSQVADHIKAKGGIYTASSSVARVLASFLCLVPLTVFLVIILTLSDMSVPSILMYVFSYVLLPVGVFTLNYAVDKWHAGKKAERIGTVLLGVALSLMGIFGMLSVYYTQRSEKLVFDFSIALAAAAAASFAGMILAAFMKKRTDVCVEWMGRLLGFREFIETAELDRLKAMAEEKPEWFYHALPYTYVFGLADTFAKRLEDLAIPAPEWYVSTSPDYMSWNYYRFNRAMMKSMSTMTTTLTMVKPSEASAGTSGGGGSFSGGGGGFSGGGFGGGGGGSW